MTVSQGDISFVGINTQGAGTGSDQDWFAFVALNDIAAGDVVYFTDNELTSSSATSFNGSPTGGESYIKWIAPAGGITAGSVIQVQVMPSQSTQPVASTGAASWVVSAGSTGAGLSASSESIYAFTAADDSSVVTPTSFLAQIYTGTAADPSPASLSSDYVISFADGSDGAYYSGFHSGYPAYTDYAALIADTANWTRATGDLLYTGTQAQPFGTAALSTVSVSDASIAEGNIGTTIVSFTVSLNSASVQAVTIDYATADGTATAGTDYAAASGTLTFAPGETSKTVSVTLYGDTVFEASETLTLDLSNADNATIADAQGVATITNDDTTIVYGTGYVDVNGIRIYDQADSTLHGDTTTPVATDDVVLVRLGSIAGTSAGAESIAFENGKAYSTNINGNAINVYQVAADGALSNLAPILLSGLTNYKAGGVNSVAVHDGVIAVAYENAAAGQGGYIALLNAADNSLIKTVQVGVLPDQVTFTPDGSKILVANEGEAISTTNNPVGTVSIIDLSSGAANAAVVNTISFEALNGSEALLKAQGLALYPGQAAAADIEPEYIAVSADGTRAYVTLQEVNAVAVIDLTDPTATAPLSIQPLGYVDRNLDGNEFDASDRDGAGGTAAINLQNWDVYGLLQPDAIATFSTGGATYFVTANEGDARVGTGIADTDIARLATVDLDNTLFPNEAALKANAALGRLNVLTKLGDTDGDGDIDQIYAMGGRSITVFRQNADGTITKVSETGGEFEAIIAANHASLFNSNQSVAASSVDTRSDDKGPEPEAVTIGEINGRTYAFVGLERVGGVMVYDMTDPANPTFVGYRPETASDLGPEVLKFIDAAHSPTGQALVLSGNEISNTVTLYSVQTQSERDDAIIGGSAAETWNGRGGNDSIRGNGGNDIINGGDGNDTAVFAGNAAAATITRVGTTFTVASVDGTDTVTAVETFQFADASVDAGSVNIAAGLSGAQAVLAHGTEDLAYTVTAAQLLTGFTDANGDALAVTVIGADRAGVIDNGDGTWTLNPDANANGTITVSYAVTDGHGGSTAATLAIEFDAVNDAPVSLSINTATIAENSAEGTLVGTVSTVDIDDAAGFAYSLVDNDGGRFVIDEATGELRVAAGAVLDFEVATTRTVIIRAADQDGASVEQAIIVSLNDVAEQQSFTGTRKADTFDGVNNNNWTVDGGQDGDVLTTHGGQDRIDGGQGNDSLSSGAGDDILNGGLGDDTLSGGLGADRLTGGSGKDRFVFSSVDDSNVASGVDHITDFQAKTDLIDLSGIDANAALAGDQAFAFIGAAAFTDLGQVRIGSLGDHLAILGNVSGDTAADFAIILDTSVSLKAVDFVL